MNFFTVFIYFFLFFFKCNNYTSFLSKATEAYNTFTKKDAGRAIEYMQSGNVVTPDMKKIVTAFFNYKDGFHVIPTLRAIEKESEGIRNMRKLFYQCLRDGGKKNEDVCQRVNGGAIITDLLVENFFLKIFNLEVSQIVVDETKNEYEKTLCDYIKTLSAFVRTAIPSVLAVMSERRTDNILNKGMVLENYLPLKQNYFKEKNNMNEFIKTKEASKIILYLQNDYESIKRVILSFLKFIQDQEEFSEVEKKEYNKTLEAFNSFFDGKPKNKKDGGAMSIKELLEGFIQIVNTQKKNIEKDPERLKNFLAIFYSSLLDFDRFQNQKNFIDYFEKCYYSDAFLQGELRDDYHILNKIFPFNINDELIDKKEILSKNFKSLLLIKLKNQSGTEKLDQEINLKDDEFFKLILKNVSDFDFKEDKFIKNKEFDLPVLGLTFKEKYITNNYYDFYNQYVKNFFLSSDSFLLKDIIKELELSDNRFFRFLQNTKNLRYENKSNPRGWLIFRPEEMTSLNKTYAILFQNYINKYKIYNDFLTDISLVISVFFLKDFYHPYSWVGYQLGRHRNKLLFLGALFTGIAVFYIHRNKSFPQAILNKAKEYIFPFLSKYTSIFKQKFGSAISLIRRP